MTLRTAETAFDRFLYLLGRLNYSWTNTESLLIHAIAGLARTDKETAVIIFLTLNTTRARVDLVERLVKREDGDRRPAAEVLDLTARLQRHSGLRNRLNHSIYAFDPAAGTARTIMMKIADRKTAIKLGRSGELDAAAIEEIEASLTELAALNKDFWALILREKWPV